MKYLLYSTSASDWYVKKCQDIARAWSMTPGRGKVTIDVVRRVPEDPVTIKDSDGDRRFAWDWFETYFDNEEYDGIFFHFTPYYKRRWLISRRINGAKHTHRKDKPFFWVACDKEEADGYPLMSEFERLMYHEMGHFDEDLMDKLDQDSVHKVDYKLKQIHYYHLLIDYSGLNAKRSMWDLMKRAIAYTQEFIKSLSSPR